MTIPRDTKKVDEGSAAWMALTSRRTTLESEMTKRALKYQTGSLAWMASFEAKTRPRPLNPPR